MRKRYVVDTNVLIAASAAMPTTPKEIDATPQDPELRLQIWEWLNEFAQSKSTNLVLDTACQILEEYYNKLGFNDYGIQVVMDKFATAAVDNVEVAYDGDGHGVLPVNLEGIIHDRADRKMVAAALEAHQILGEGCVAFAGDTDWHGWEVSLGTHGILLEPIIEDWSRQKYAEKLAR